MPAVPSASLALPPPGADVAACRAWAVALPIEIREAMEDLFDPVMLRGGRLSERNGLLLHMAASIASSTPGISQRSIAEAHRHRLARPGSDIIAQRTLLLNKGEVLEAENIRTILRLGKNSSRSSPRHRS